MTSLSSRATTIREELWRVVPPENRLEDPTIWTNDGAIYVAAIELPEIAEHIVELHNASIDDTHYLHADDTGWTLQHANSKNNWTDS